jgi:hypothetical protein
VEMAAAQSVLLHKYPGQYYLCRIQGRGLDMGTPRGYMKTLQALQATWHTE